MGDVIDLNAERRKRHTCDDGCDYVGFLAFCVTCMGRWMGQAPSKTNFFVLECPYCGVQDSFVSLLPDYFYLPINPEGPNGAA